MNFYVIVSFFIACTKGNLDIGRVCQAKVKADKARAAYTKAVAQQGTNDFVHAEKELNDALGGALQMKLKYSPAYAVAFKNNNDVAAKLKKNLDEIEKTIYSSCNVVL